jgi:hypothetical protein
VSWRGNFLMFNHNARRLTKLVTDILPQFVNVLNQQVEINLLLSHRLEVLEARAGQLLPPDPACDCQGHMEACDP